MQACPQAHVYNPYENTARAFLNEKFENPIQAFETPNSRKIYYIERI